MCDVYDVSAVIYMCVVSDVCVVFMCDVGVLCAQCV